MCCRSQLQLNWFVVWTLVLIGFNGRGLKSSLRNEPTTIKLVCSEDFSPDWLQRKRTEVLTTNRANLSLNWFVVRTLVLIGFNGRGLKSSLRTYNCYLFDMILIDTEALTKLKLAMLSAKTVAQLAAIIIDYTHEEMMLVFHELEWEQQARINIWKSV
jgi:hypothetical protein